MWQARDAESSIAELQRLLDEVLEIHWSDPDTRGRFQRFETAFYDAVYGARSVVYFYQRDLESTIRRNQAIITGSADSEGETENWRGLYAASIKSLYFLIRVYCDALYGLMLTLLGQPPGPEPSMNGILNGTKNPVRLLIEERSTNFTSWFRRFRTRRNNLKTAMPTCASSVSSPGRFELRLRYFKDGDLSFEFTCKDVDIMLTRALEMTEVAVCKLRESSFVVSGEEVENKEGNV